MARAELRQMSSQIPGFRDVGIMAASSAPTTVDVEKVMVAVDLDDGVRIDVTDAVNRTRVAR
jgi:hypothetical protein